MCIDRQSQIHGTHPMTGIVARPMRANAEDSPSDQSEFSRKPGTPEDPPTHLPSVLGADEEPRRMMDMTILRLECRVAMKDRSSVTRITYRQSLM